MTRDLDLTRPGPAGLYFRPDRLTPSALADEMAARARLETHCSICGTIPAPYGFGRWNACDDLSCRSDAEAQMDADKAPRAAERPVETAQRPAGDPHPLALFSSSEAA